MSSSAARGSSTASAAAASRDRSLRQLLDPTDLLPGHTTADLYSLRHFTLRGGLPDSPGWLRAQAWKVLLGYLPPEKKEWSSTLAKRRREYYQFLNDLSPPADPSHKPIHPNKLTDNDRLLDQIYKDLVRSRKNGFAFYQASPQPSASCPIVPVPAFDTTQLLPTALPVQRLETRDNLLHRLAAISHGYAQQLSLERIASTSSSAASRHSPPRVLHVQTDTGNSSQPMDDPIKSPPILLSPPSPGGMSRESSQHSFASANEALESTPTSPDHHDNQATIQAQAAIASTHSCTPADDPAASIPTQRNWHSLLRILYLFALLNPSIGYVQGMNEALFTLVYVFGSSQYPHPVGDTLTPSNSQTGIATSADGTVFRSWDNQFDLVNLTTHAEADAFWCFSALIGEMRELYDFDNVDQHARGGAGSAVRSQSGMAGALRRFSLRIKWLDPPLWRDLRAASLDPQLPYYSLRWLACLLSTELSLPSVLRIWDALLAEQETAGVSGSAKIEFLIDVCASMVLQTKDRLPSSEDDLDMESEGFSRGMRVLQEYPDDDISPVVEAATLTRQRRLAADLTGDGPPNDSDDDESANASFGAVKARAAQAWRDWKSPRQDASHHPDRTAAPAEAAPPTTKGGWLVSRARQRPSLTSTEDADVSIASSADGAASEASTSSKTSFSGFLAKYAEAVQSSDAAANFSKASTNLTAKAMAFADRNSRESTPEASASPQINGGYGSLGRGFATPPIGSQNARFSSLGSIGTGFFTKSRRNASESVAHPTAWGSPHTPDMTRWSRETMADFPLPNVSDDPAGRMEYVDTYGKRISMAQNGRRGASPSSSAAGDDHMERRASETGTSNFPLPSMRAAARMGILPSRIREESASPSSRSTGPKPLLLSQSARPPREGNSSPRSLAVDEPSRKISSGPMAHSMSRGNSHQDSRSSAAGSLRSSRSASVADSRRSSIVDLGESSMPGLLELGALPPLPSLAGQSSAGGANGHSMHSGSSAARILPSGVAGPQGSVSKEGTVSAGAFARATKTADPERDRPEFGHVTSSSDVPLVQATSSSISRPRASNRNRTSSSTIESHTASTLGSLTGNQISNRSSQTTNVVDSPADQNALSSYGFVDSPGVSEDPITYDVSGSLDDAVTKSGWRAAPLEAATDRYDTPAGGNESPTRPETIRKYTLTDEPLSSPTTGSTIVRSKRVVKGRQNSSSSVATNASRRSLAALRRSSRNSIVDPTPTSPRLPLPEVEEHMDAYGGIADGIGGEEVNGSVHDTDERGYYSYAVAGDTPREQSVDVRSLRIGDDQQNAPTSPLSISRNGSGARPSTDRSGFI
ncbi:hypothetical protein PHSY_004672 [Pseudozyma hubeiensis SY62]|uniref:Rab-GAP TBC domain-containing protein n=1 Tax=Pseudozyma hubeiensis (strain SY62) TaxID=1305764 RepID=R9P6Q3_PSEHS|nr:hypothetical protein PHSY_004672 [Pseudozyma hubeiensis SY62]GAC97088.1 hypothetical protein PHSY_004672 [Pseudozyma hubeiensis SY62]